MVVLQKILADETQRGAFPETPKQLSVESRIRRLARVREAANKIRRCIPSQAVPEEQVRPELGGIVRAASLGFVNGRHILTCGSDMHMDLLKRISGAESPTMGRLPIHGDLDSMCFSV